MRNVFPGCRLFNFGFVELRLIVQLSCVRRAKNPPPKCLARDSQRSVFRLGQLAQKIPTVAFHAWLHALFFDSSTLHLDTAASVRCWMYFRTEEERNCLPVCEANEQATTVDPGMHVAADWCASGTNRLSSLVHLVRLFSPDGGNPLLILNLPPLLWLRALLNFGLALCQQPGLHKKRN